MTPKQKLTTLFILLVTAWTLFLFFCVTMYKTEAWFIDRNTWYQASLYGLTFMTIVYAYCCITRKIVLAISITLVLLVLVYPLSTKLVDAFVAFLIARDHQQTPLGWTFRLRWLDLFVTHIGMLIGLIVLARLIPTQWRGKVVSVDYQD